MNKRNSILINGSIFSDKNNINHDEFLHKFMQFIDGNGLKFRGATSIFNEQGKVEDYQKRYDGKYTKLYEFLFQRRSCYPEISLSFTEIEEILQFNLPKSAYKYGAWWSNETSGTHSHARAWILAGWKTAKINLGTSINFMRE
ncbi:DUF7662 domain-containing protein [Peribacillus glennii]|uniref:DUF7662 domain-containing protein n=1 Tax=Peribacillus glennii TaxID=2303991 RepID=A0A372L7L9_9BACI|nr:hypothetical protein [Peribacillus glennii]RFU61258.1 hypothetical protein D0466_18765 [Peribacillus glennii]